MVEYLIFLKLGAGLATAILAAIVIWERRGNNNIDKPIELEDEYAIPKPEEEIMEGIEYDEIKTNINNNNNEQIN